MINAEITIDNTCLGDKFQLVDVKPDNYMNGQRLETPQGYRYEVCVRAHRNDKLVVKIPGAMRMEAPSTMAEVYVTFEGLKVRPYVDRNGRLAFTASADDVKTVRSGEDNAKRTTDKPA